MRHWAIVVGIVVAYVVALLWLAAAPRCETERVTLGRSFAVGDRCR
jgi:hypothetical protein